MKRRSLILLTIAILICAVITALVACDHKENTEEKPMENGPKSTVSITVQGMVGEKCVVNPAFSWSSTEQSAQYDFLLKSASGEVICEEKGKSSTLYEVSVPLAADREYTFTVTETGSGATDSVTFRTADVAPALESAAITLADPYRSHMVIQRDRRIALKGRTTPYVLLLTDYFGTRVYAAADENGDFTLDLPAVAANATPTDLEIKILAGASLTLEDILFGDVYLASGQSNMWWKLRDSDYDETADVDNAISGDMRFYSMKITKSTTPMESVKDGKWAAISRGNNAYKDYSAIGFMTGSMLTAALEESGVPIGIIQSAEGDTNIANWLSSEYYDGSVSTKNINYNAMIYPLRYMELKGVIWYQGCNNSAKGCDYEGLLGDLFANWRELFHNETLPFYVVQLPVFNGDSGNNYDFSFVRESQLLACEKDDNAYLIATCDGGDPGYIHPRQKRYIAERLSKSILSTLYGANYLPQGPTYKSHTVEGRNAIITVDNGDGLYVKAGESIRGFMLAGADGKYFDATASIENGRIVVTSDKVSSPVYIKYGFSKSPYLNIYNKDGYLMSPFRTDDHGLDIDLLDYRGDPTEGKRYALHADGSEMNYAVVEEQGETGLAITKANDGKGFGSLILTKLGAIAYREPDLDLTITLVGTNSGAKVAFRVVEGSYEIWSYTITDDFSGKRTFTVSTTDMVCAGNLVDGDKDFQAVRQVEVTLTAEGAATITVLGVKFSRATRTAPRAFTLREARDDGHTATVKYTRAGFADEYRVIVSKDNVNYTSPVLDRVTRQAQITFDPALLTEDVTYYVKVVARNELGETVATGSGMILSTLDRYVVAEMDFADDASFNAFSSRLNVKPCLTASRSDKGLRVNVREKDKDSWSYCILRYDNGANVGYDALRFYADFTEFAGDYVMIQLQNEAGSASYSYALYYKSAGYVEIPLSSFKRNGASFDGSAMAKIAFNIVDYSAGGAEDNIYIRDIEFIKK